MRVVGGLRDHREVVELVREERTARAFVHDKEGDSREGAVCDERQVEVHVVDWAVLVDRKAPVDGDGLDRAERGQSQHDSCGQNERRLA
jgi:hypothetical protein